MPKLTIDGKEIEVNEDISYGYVTDKSELILSKVLPTFGQTVSKDLVGVIHA